MQACPGWGNSLRVALCWGQAGRALRAGGGEERDVGKDVPGPEGSGGKRVTISASGGSRELDPARHSGYPLGSRLTARRGLAA